MQPFAAKPSCRLIAMLVAFCCIGDIVQAHPDYEQPAATLADADGNPLRAVLHYTDGIMGNDPVKLVLYDEQKQILAETPYYRDILVYQSTDEELHVFAVGFWSLLFHKTWLIERGEMRPNDSDASVGYAMIATVRAHWLGYTFSIALLIGSLTRWLGRQGLNPSRFCDVFSSGCVWILWLCVVALHVILLQTAATRNSGYLGPLLISTCTVMVFLFWLWRRGRVERSCAGLTSFSAFWLLFVTMLHYCLSIPLIVVASLFVVLPIVVWRYKNSRSIRKRKISGDKVAFVS